jgi:hypothetical protein
LDGIWTVRRLRPFLRRLDSTARPHRVFMRCRNPCLFTRLRLRGRYVGPTCEASGKPRIVHAFAVAGQG